MNGSIMLINTIDKKCAMSRQNKIKKCAMSRQNKIKKKKCSVSGRIALAVVPLMIQVTNLTANLTLITTCNNS